MTAVNLHLSPLIEHLAGREYQREGRQVQETVRLTIGRLRRLLFQLTPPELQRHGLASSLRLLLETLQEDSGVRWELDDRLIEEPAPAAALVVYRIVQEALHNCEQHAGARQVEVAVRQEQDRLQLLIRDDGRGFDTRRERGMGLLGIEERVNHLGGSVTVDSTPGSGTSIEVVLPLK